MLCLARRNQNRFVSQPTASETALCDQRPACTFRQIGCRIQQMSAQPFEKLESGQGLAGALRYPLPPVSGHHESILPPAVQVRQVRREERDAGRFDTHLLQALGKLALSKKASVDLVPCRIDCNRQAFKHSKNAHPSWFSCTQNMQDSSRFHRIVCLGMRCTFHTRF